ncbi:membrane protein [Yeosuana aromativorans]|uniref:Membrane protein n=1 Tax=Yeosuana aromativorans TaxID=288019 RepID=A0A8J3FEI2_9FLAO|nr:threonine/serine exporter family protein [Yeosuana aromativorans]GGK15777.1 membrane protein [Yeosuana aromativorans]
MLEVILKLLEVSFWSGVAAVGFGLLFNIPKNSVLTVFMLGAGAGFIKFLLIHFNVHVVLSSFVAAFFVGLVCIPMAHKIHQPPVVFSIPPVIPMIPGYFAYETVLSIMDFIFMEENPVKRVSLIDSIFTNGFTMFFILISLTVGVALPMLLLNKKTVKRLGH